MAGADNKPHVQKIKTIIQRKSRNKGEEKKMKALTKGLQEGKAAVEP